MGYSPFLEWRFAAQWAHYTVEQFEALDGERQSMIIASYRASNQIEAVLSKDAEDRSRRESRKK